jgi:multisubunit Na+/H+ antiporter MnhC subunit
MMSTELHWLLYGGAIGLIAIGAAGIVMSKHLFRVILALAIAEAGANLLLVVAGLKPDATAPILMDSLIPQTMVDPVPQAMVLTAIVIGVGIQALILSLAVMVYKSYGTLNMKEIRLKMAADIDSDAGVDAGVSEDKPAGERPLGIPKAVPTGEARS